MTHTAPIPLPVVVDVDVAVSSSKLAETSSVETQSVARRIHVALEAEDWRAVTSLIGDNWSSLLRTSRETVRAAVSALPDAVVDAQPRWAAAREYLNYSPQGSGPRPVKYEKHEGSSGMASELLDVLAQLTSRSASERSHGRFQLGAEAAREAIALAGGATPDAVAEFRPVIADLRVQWAISLLLAGATREAAVQFEATFDDAVTFDNSRTATEAAGSLAFIHSVNGDLQAARAWLARQPLDVRGVAAVAHAHADQVTAMGALAAANIAIDELDEDAARAALVADPGDEFAPEQWALRLYVVSRAEVLFGDAYAQLIRNRAAAQARVPYLSASGLNAWALHYAASAILYAVNDVEGAAEAVASLEAVDAEPATESARVFTTWMLANTRSDAQVVVDSAQCLTRAPSLRGSAEMMAASVSGHLHTGHVDQAMKLFRSLAVIVAEQGLLSVLTRFDDDALEALLAGSGVDLDEVALERRARANPRMFARLPDVQLTDRERVVLRHLLSARTLEEIAVEEHVSRNTIKSQTRSLFRKLGVSSREAAVEFGLEYPALWAESGL
ncbi:response regulator transcription factor [Pseudoclavibacter sp. JSM 162008]|uniref:response regulator transcription factor n=1 Tax=Pseudoclavibacter sp. JSM 162008 TaxID=3229855 RepID=UPI0035237BF4